MNQPPLFELSEHLESVERGASYSKTWVVFGSTVMWLHGLRDEVGDVDIWVTPLLWGRLIARGWQWKTPRAGDPPLAEKVIEGVPVHAFFDWEDRHSLGPRIDLLMFNCAERIPAGDRSPQVFASSLTQVLRWKKIAYGHGYKKHDRDIQVIEKHLARAKSQ